MSEYEWENLLDKFDLDYEYDEDEIDIDAIVLNANVIETIKYE